jgi:hypothetical protein
MSDYTASISVDVSLAGDANSPYTDLGNMSVSVDVTTSTTTSLWVNRNTTGFGGTAILTAVVSPDIAGFGDPSGTVEFYAGTTDLGSGTLAYNPSCWARWQR